MVWLIWKGRNEVIFRNDVLSGDKIVENVKVRSWSWLYVKDLSSFCFSFYDWSTDRMMMCW